MRVIDTFFKFFIFHIHFTLDSPRRDEKLFEIVYFMKPVWKIRFLQLRAQNSISRTVK